MSKVLVVGGAGYVGCVLVPHLLDNGYQVRVLDRLWFGEDGLAPVRGQIELVEGDMRKVPPYLLDDIDAVVCLGGLSNDPVAEYQPGANAEVNYLAVAQLALLCRNHGRARRFIFASTASIYDTGILDDARDDVVQTEQSKVSPTKPYSNAKWLAEQELLAMAGENGFCPVVLRKGTVFGWSPRMRFDLVVNTFVKDALSKGVIAIHAGGEMWRPLVDILDVARAYVACLKADEDKVRGEIFNVTRRNYRISELALWIRDVLFRLGIPVELRVSYSQVGVRSYRISGAKFRQRLNFEYTQDVEHSVQCMVDNLIAFTDWDNPRYYNIRWMKMLEEAKSIIDVTGQVF